MVKVIFLDLSNLRFGIWLGSSPMKNVDGRCIVSYRPINSFISKKIPNIIEQSIIDVSKEEVGGLGDADYYKIMLKGEMGESHFLDRILSVKYGRLVEEINKKTKEMEIRKGVEESRGFEVSQDILTEMKRFEEIFKSAQKFGKPKRREVSPMEVI